MKRAILLGIIFIGIWGISCGSPTLPEHTVLKEEVSDMPIKTQVEMKILVPKENIASGKITKDSLEVLLNGLHKQIKKRKGFEYHKHPTAVYIYAYTTKERAETTFDWIAMLQQGVDMEPSISVRETRIKSLRAGPEEKFGFTKDERREIFKEVVKAKDKATDPTTLEIDERLKEKYTREVAQKYKLTPERLDSIVIEGIVEGWPMPEFSEIPD